MILELTPDELLSTTRAVRKRLDLTRPVEREVLEECLALAQQAPTASYSQNWHFVVVTDAAKRAALGEIWREVAVRTSSAAAREEQGARIGDAVVHLAEHIHEVPVHVIPCVQGRVEESRTRSSRRSSARSSRPRGASCSRRARAGSARC